MLRDANEGEDADTEEFFNTNQMQGEIQYPPPRGSVHEEIHFDEEHA
jgi:hypothetical protein